jgi:hypothetical protein
MPSPISTAHCQGGFSGTLRQGLDLVTCSVTSICLPPVIHRGDTVYGTFVSACLWITRLGVRESSFFKVQGGKKFPLENQVKHQEKFVKF